MGGGDLKGDRGGCKPKFVELGVDGEEGAA